MTQEAKPVLVNVPPRAGKSALAELYADTRRRLGDRVLVVDRDAKPEKRPLTLDEQLFLAIEEMTRGPDRALVYMQMAICQSCAHLQALEDVPGPPLVPLGSILFDFRSFILAARKRARA